MLCASCPNCGFALERLNHIKVGDLEIFDNGHYVTWKGQTLRATAAEKLVLATLARSPGHVFRRMALAEAIGSEERRDPENLISVLLNRLKKAFRAIDPGFDQIESVRSGRNLAYGGLRWKVEETELV